MAKRGIRSSQPRSLFSTTCLRSGSSPNPTSTAFPVFQPSFWRSLLPKRNRLRSESSNPSRPHWLHNPSTHVIILALLAGSQAIQILALKREHLNYTLRADAYIAKLEEVIGRVQKGEDVDVKKELGTGDERREKEWEEVMEEIQKEDELFARRKKKKENNASPGVEGNDAREGQARDQAPEGNAVQYQAPSGASPSLQIASSGVNTHVRFY